MNFQYAERYKHLKTARYFLLIPTILLLISGVIMQYSCNYTSDILIDFSSFENFLSPLPVRQLVWIFIGGVIAIIISILDYKTLVKYIGKPLLFGAGIALIYLAVASFLHAENLPFIGSTKGGYRWLEGPGFLRIIKIQPSEFAKLGVTLYICDYFANYQNILHPSQSFFAQLGACLKWLWHKITGQDTTAFQVQIIQSAKQSIKELWHTFIWPILIIGIIILLVMMGRSMSMTILFVSQCLLLMLCSGTRFWLLAIAFIAIGYGVWCGHDYGRAAPFKIYQQTQLYQPVDEFGNPLHVSPYNFLGNEMLDGIFTPERLERLTSWKHPELLQMTGGAQLWRSQLALGSGGMHGLGFGESRIKRKYLPEAHNDFIISVIGEEFGFIGTLFCLIMYAWLVIAAFGIAWFAYPRLHYSLPALGLGLSLGGHAFINIGVASGFLPTTGITAPFLSYGGSSMIVSLVTIGLLISIANSAYKEGEYFMLNHNHDDF